MEENKGYDAVESPEHYQGTDIECIDMMEVVFGPDDVDAFCLMNAFKYLYRCKKKNGMEDIAKAEWYLNRVKESDFIYITQYEGLRKLLEKRKKEFGGKKNNA